MTDNGVAAKEKPWQQLEEDKRKSDATDVGIRVTDDGKVYEVHFGELSALDVRELRLQTGYSASGLIRQALDDPDVDTMAAVIWLARRMTGERQLTYVEVAAGLKWGMAGRRVEFVSAVPDAPPEIVDAASGKADRPQA